MTENCKNCWWWKSFGESNQVGQCRRHAPTTVEVEDPNTFSGREQHTMWPITNGDDWCGDFQHNVICDPDMASHYTP